LFVHAVGTQALRGTFFLIKVLVTTALGLFSLTVSKWKSYVECGSTAMAVDSATANSNEEDSTAANYSLAVNSATTNYSRIRRRRICPAYLEKTLEKLFCFATMFKSCKQEVQC
jgi:hypothetical protein